MAILIADTDTALANSGYSILNKALVVNLKLGIGLDNHLEGNGVLFDAESLCYARDLNGDITVDCAL